MEENTEGGNIFDLSVCRTDWSTEFFPEIYTDLACVCVCVCVCIIYTHIYTTNSK